MKIAAINIEGNGTFAQDVPALADAIKAGGDELVLLLPGNSRVKRAAAAAAMRAGAEIDTNVVDVDVADGKAVARRWVYRQRIFTTFRLSSPISSTGLFSSLKTIPSSMACSTSSFRAGSSSRERR